MILSQLPFSGKERALNRFAALLTIPLVLFSACSEKHSSNPVDSPTSSGLAVVCTTGDNEYNISVVDYVNNKAYNDLLSVSKTCKLTQYGDYVYIIDKNSDRIIKFDPVNRTAVGELSMGPKSAPESIVFVSSTKAYVTLSDSAAVKVINPSSMTLTKSISIASLGDPDGDPDQGNGVIKDGKLYVSLRRANGNNLNDYSSIAVINTAADTVMTEIRLNTNGIAGTNDRSLGGDTYGSTSVTGNLYAYVIGSIAKGTDGAIELVDTSAMTTTTLMTESEIGGNILCWVFDTPTTGWAMAGLSSTSGGEGYGLKRFNLNTLTFTSVSAFQGSERCWAMDVTPDGLVLVGSQDENNPGIWVYDSKNSYKPVFEKPIDVGLIPSRLIVVR